ncbi:C39 family peptidase [Anoxybacillus flavithermus]|nr:C39 family peptidase [Anoxybacillus flavithermus]MBE2914469.1 hypothetical protein [Anoxybacillus flavithermus]
MKKRKLISTLMLGSILCLPVVAQANSPKQEISTQSISYDTISVEEAKKAINNFIKKNEQLYNLRDGKIVFKEHLYDIDDTVVGYYFAVESEKTKGYFITSAVDTIDPMIQYGVDVDLEETLNKKMKDEKVYYFGVNKFSFGKSGKEVKEKFEKAKSATLKKLKDEKKDGTEEYKKVEKAQLKSLKKGDKRSPGWDGLLKDSGNGMVSIAATDYKVLSGVDRIYQRSSGINNPNSACGPTVAAMIMDYYHDELGYNVRDNAYYGSWAALVNHLYNEMGSTWLGTTITMWANGALTHVYHTSNAWSSNTVTDAVGNSSKFIGAIDSNDPVAIRFDLFDSGGTSIEYHFVCGIGYDKNGSYAGDLHVAYKDPDNGADNTGTHWFDWTDDDQDIDFAWLS